MKAVIPLSVRITVSINTGLAMVAAIMIALWMDFKEPQWAGFAVAMISLDTAGQSLNKAGMRMFGTLVAFVASLTFMGLFPQQRWLMLLALTPYLGFCAYMFAGNRHQYFWYVCAFVCLTIMVHSGNDSLSMFQFAVARLEETALGILVYSVVSMLLWPRNSRAALDQASRALLETQTRLFRAYGRFLTEPGCGAESRSLGLQEVQQLTQLRQVLNAAETDTFEVWELRHAWRRFLQQSTMLAESLGRWRTCLPEVRPLDLAPILPSLEESLSELDHRLEQIAAALSGGGLEADPRDFDLRIEEHQMRGLSHFDRAAIAQLVIQLRKLDAVTRALFACARDIAGSERIASPRMQRPHARSAPALDPERLRAAFSVVTAAWVGFAFWIWVDPPGHASFWYLTTLWTMVAVMGHTAVSSMLPGFAISLGAGGIAYVFVMPHLSGFTELGLLIFCWTAGASYLFWNRPGERAFLLAIFLVVTSIENEQTYSFSMYANTSASVLLTVALAAALAYFPSSPRPEKVFLRLLRRFFRHAEMLLSQLAPDSDLPRGLLARWRSLWFRNDLLELPQKLEMLADRIDFRLLPGSSPAQVRGVVTQLLALTMRVKELVEARESVEPDPRLEEVVAELREWRLLAQHQFRLWADDPSAALAPSADMSERLHRRLAGIEADLEGARERAGDLGFGGDYEPLHRYLGAFRGLSEAGIEYSRLAGNIDWARWQEARF